MFVDKNSGKALNKTHSEFSPLPVSSKETLPEVKTSLFQLQNGTAEADTFKQWMAEQADPQQQAKTILLNTMDPLANSGKNRSLQAAQTLSIEGVIKGLLKLLGMTDASSLFNLQKPSAANNTVTNNSTLPVSSNPPPTQPATEAATDPATGAAVISGTPDSAAIMPASVHSSATVAEALPPPPVAAPAPLGSTTAAAITPAVPALPNPTTASPLPDTTNFIQNSTIQIHDPDAKASSRVSFNAQQGKWIVSWGDRDATGSGLYLTQDPTLGTWVPVFRNTPIGNPPHSTDILLETPAQVNLSTLPTKYPDEIIAPPRLGLARILSTREILGRRLPGLPGSFPCPPFNRPQICLTIQNGS